MNPTQRIILIAGAVAIGAMALFPPWLYVYRSQHAQVPFGGNNAAVITDTWERPAGYHFVFNGAPAPTFGDIDTRYISTRIDRERFAVQIIGIVLPIILLCLAFSKKKTNPLV